MNCEQVKYDTVAANIPKFMQTLYVESNINSISLQEVRDAFRINQMQSKAWLLDQVKNIDKKASILVIGSWIGFTSYCLYKLGFENITEIDPDHRLSSISQTLNGDNKHFKHLNEDVNNIDLVDYNLIINTSCEHIGNNQWFDKVQSGCFLALQSTNLKWHDHVNTVETVDEMASKYKLNLNYSGELYFNPTYSRFMLVGTKP